MTPPTVTTGADRPVVSVTRIALRARRFVPFFLIHAQRCLVQIRRADGYMTGALCHDRDGAYWTATLWRDERALMAYVRGGAHRSVMPRLTDWAGAACFVRWTPATADLPDWSEAALRMHQHGTSVTVPYPIPATATSGAIDPVHTARI